MTAILARLAVLEVLAWRSGMADPFKPALVVRDDDEGRPASSPVYSEQGDVVAGGGEPESAPGRVRAFLALMSRVPMRHSVAALLTSVGLLLLASLATTTLAILGGLWTTVRALVDNPSTVFACDPLPEDITDKFLCALVIMLQLLPDFTREQILGTVADVFTYTPFGVWIVNAAIICAVVYSFVPVVRQQAVYAERYKAALAAYRAAGGGEHEAILARPRASDPSDTFHLAPDLRRFAAFSATQYILSHVILHLVASFVTTALVAAIATVLVVYAGGFPALLVLATLAARSQLLKFCTTTLPPLLITWVLVPGLALFGLESAAVLAPLRWLYMRLVFWVRFDDGPRVFSPRVLMAVDAVTTCTLGAALAVVDALTRMILGLLWGLLRTVVLHEPVVPAALAFLDRPYKRTAA